MSDSERTDETGEDTRRADLIQGIRELADFLEQTPAVPTPSWAAAHVPHYLTDQPVGKHEMAAVGGVVTVNGDKVEADREFRGGVSLKVVGKAADICVAREVTSTTFVLPDELAPPEPQSEMDEVEKTPVTW